MKLLEVLYSELRDGEVVDVCIGVHWTAVVVRIDGEMRCGLSSTLALSHEHTGVPDVPDAGHLESHSAAELARWSFSEQSILACIGVAALNALLPPQRDRWREVNAEEMIADMGKGKEVVLVGSFPFVSRLRPRVGGLTVLELRPKEGELPAEAAPEVIPRADVVAITSMTLVNHSLEELLELRGPQAKVLLLGPSTPMAPLLFDRGIDVLSGSYVTKINPVLAAIKQGANFRQVHHAGVRLVTMVRDE